MVGTAVERERAQERVLELIYEYSKHVTWPGGQREQQRIDILEWSSARTVSRVFLS